VYGSSAIVGHLPYPVISDKSVVDDDCPAIACVAFDFRITTKAVSVRELAAMRLAITHDRVSKCSWLTLLEPTHFVCPSTEVTGAVIVSLQKQNGHAHVV
jgi:hypothetical protein